MPATPAPAISFPLPLSGEALVAAGETDGVTISGMCGGTVASETLALSLANCAPATTATADIAYSDPNYTPLGTSSPGEEYDVVKGTLAPLPTDGVSN